MPTSEKTFGNTMNGKKAKEIIEILENEYFGAKPQLIFNGNYELLIAVMLSAQCTDERVNKVTKVLFKEYNTPEKMITLTQEELEKYIFTCGLYHSKARHILSATKDILEKFGGRVPEDFSSLKSLAGVGQKTANVVSSVGMGKDAIAVDTHVFRVSKRLGLSKGKTPLEVERDLNKAIEKSKWSNAHHYLIYHGRRVCKAQKPNCENCKLNKLCESAFKVNKK